MTKLPPMAELLGAGGDSRIMPAAATGLNKYGCSLVPSPDVVSFASCTASAISQVGFSAAHVLYERLAVNTESPSITYRHETDRIRGELLRLLGLTGTDIIFAASGTDLHLIAGQMAAGAYASPLLAILPEMSETGSGVHHAIGGRHFSECAAFSPALTRGAPVEGAQMNEIATVAIRDTSGLPHHISAIDGEVAALVEHAVAAGRHVLLTLIDVSKTGMIAPSPGCARMLRQRFPDKVDILVDACQFRIAPSTLEAYITQGFMVAITGSKFAGGPAFSGALLLSKAVTQRFSARALTALTPYSAKGDWPEGWAARTHLIETENYGLLLRWEAALAQLRPFYALPEEAVTGFLAEFASSVTRHLGNIPTFELLPTPEPERAIMTAAQSWDNIPTIFPFLLHHSTSDYHSREETQRIYEILRGSGYHLGQPVACGMRDGKPVTALRLCAGMRTVVDALTGKGKEAVIMEALSLLDKTAALASS